MPKENVTPLTFDFPNEWLTEFRALCREMNRPQIHVVMEAVNDYMERCKKARSQGLPPISEYKTNCSQRWLKKIPRQLNKYWIAVLSGEPIQTVAKVFKELHEAGMVGDYKSSDLTTATLTKDVACCFFDLTRYAEDLKQEDVTWEIFVEEYEKLFIQAVKELREPGHDDLVKIYKAAAEHRKISIDNNLKSGKTLTTEIVIREVGVLLKRLRDELIRMEDALPPKVSGLPQNKMPKVIREVTSDVVEKLRENPFL